MASAGSSSSSIAGNSIQSAVAFLQDPSVQSSPLAKRIAFLEAKGLSQQDIDTAIRLAAQQQQVTSPPAFASTSSPQQRLPYGSPGSYQGYGGGPYGYGYRPDLRQREGPTWKDWFIVATVGGAAGTLMYSLAKKYLLPALAPPTSTELSAARDALTAKYDEAAEILTSLQAETEEIKSTLQEQCAKVDESVDQVTSALQIINDKEASRDEDIKAMKEEVDSIRALMEKMFEKHKDAQTSSLSDIQQEVKSLKSLLARRNISASGSTSDSAGAATPTFSSNPSASTSTNAAASSSTLTPSTSMPQVGTQQPYSSPYASPYSSSSRFGLSARAAGSSSVGVSPSSSFASIANRTPAIPAWQMQSQAPPAQASPSQSQAMDTTSSNEGGSRSEGAAASTAKATTVSDSEVDATTAQMTGSASEYEQVNKPEEGSTREDEEGSSAEQIVA